MKIHCLGALSKGRGGAAAFVLLLACGGDPAGVAREPLLRMPLPPLGQGALAIVGADVVPMTGAVVLHDQTVLVRDGIIIEIGPSADVGIPADAAVLPSDGLWVLPGLVDMHAHVRRADLEAYRRAGITTLRNMWGTAEVIDLRAELAEGARHPAIFSAGPGLDGVPPAWPGSIVLTDPDEARREVQRQVGQGWDAIKVYNQLSRDVFEAILDEAAASGIAVVGHVPRASDVEQAGFGGMGTVEHLTGIAEAVAHGRAPAGWLELDEAAVLDVADVLVARGVWVCPTLAVLRHLATLNLSPDQAQRAIANQATVVKVLHDAGVPILAGTDAGIGAVPPGTTLAVELELLVAAGLSPLEALFAATVEAVRALGVADRVGTVETGTRADLVLLGANPLEDISALRTPAAVVQRGRVEFTANGVW